MEHFLPDEELEEVNAKYKVSNIARDGEGVVARIIAESYDGRWKKKRCVRIWKIYICTLTEIKNGIVKK